MRVRHDHTRLAASGRFQIARAGLMPASSFPPGRCPAELPELMVQLSTGSPPPTYRVPRDARERRGAVRAALRRPRRSTDATPTVGPFTAVVGLTPSSKLYSILYHVVQQQAPPEVPLLSSLTTCSDDSKPYMILKALDESYKNHIYRVCYHPSNW